LCGSNLIHKDVGAVAPFGGALEFKNLEKRTR